jgi:hypothetical protein
MRLLTLSDGFGDPQPTNSWYLKYFKWPEIIGLMTKGVTLNNQSRYGAGNEFMINMLKHHIDQADIVLAQWSVPKRLDLILTNQNIKFWQPIIASDPVYRDNLVRCGQDQFWISSGSTTKAVQEYHINYMSMRQHHLRSQIYIDYAKLLLDQHKIPYQFMLAYDSEYIDIDANWICHEPKKGLDSFRHQSKYKDLELNLVQPIPLVAFDFIKQYIMPKVDFQWRTDREIDAVENMLYRHYQEALKNKP